MTVMPTSPRRSSRRSSLQAQGRVHADVSAADDNDLLRGPPPCPEAVRGPLVRTVVDGMSEAIPACPGCELHGLIRHLTGCTTRKKTVGPGPDGGAKRPRAVDRVRAGHHGPGRLAKALPRRRSHSPGVTMQRLIWGRSPPPPSPPRSPDADPAPTWATHRPAAARRRRRRVRPARPPPLAQGGTPGSGGGTAYANGSNAGGRPHCTSGMLNARLTDLGAAAGNRYATLVLTNKSGKHCTTGGWSGLQLPATGRDDRDEGHPRGHRAHDHDLQRRPRLRAAALGGRPRRGRDGRHQLRARADHAQGDPAEQHRANRRDLDLRAGLPARPDPPPPVTTNPERQPTGGVCGQRASGSRGRGPGPCPASPR